MAKLDAWMTLAAQRRETDLDELFTTLMAGSRPVVERRLAELTDWPTCHAIAERAGELLRAFPFEERTLDAAARAVGLALVHEAPAHAFEKTEVVTPERSGGVYGFDIDVWRSSVLSAASRWVRRAEVRPCSPMAPPTEPWPTKPKAMHEAWMALAATRSTAALPLLLENFGYGSGPQVRDRALAFLEFPRDPRIASVIAEVLAQPGVSRTASNPYFAVMGLGLVAHGDTSHEPAVAELGRKIPQLAWLGKLPLPAPGGERTAVLTESNSARFGSADRELWDEARFIREIGDAPDDLGYRAVFADWLSEKGDPRGEFITLQLAAGRGPLSAAAARRMGALLKAHQGTWLRTIARALPVGQKAGDCADVRFENGFLTDVELNLGNFVPKPGDPVLRTVRRLQVTGFRSERQNELAWALLQSTAFDAVRELAVPALYLGAVRSTVLAQLTGLDVDFSDRSIDWPTLQPVLRVLHMPALKTLRLTMRRESADAAEVLQATLPWLCGVRELEISPTHPPPWIAAAREANVARLLVKGTGVCFDFQFRGEPSLSVAVDAVSRVGYEQWLLAPLATLDDATRRAACVRFVGQAKLPPASVLASLQALGVIDVTGRG